MYRLILFIAIIIRYYKFRGFVKLEVSGSYEGRRETENTKEKELYIREIFHDVVAANRSGYLTVLFVGEKQRHPVLPSRSRLCINASLAATASFLSCVMTLLLS